MQGKIRGRGSGQELGVCIRRAVPVASIRGRTFFLLPLLPLRRHPPPLGEGKGEVDGTASLETNAPWVRHGSLPQRGRVPEGQERENVR